ncbi:MAG: hypothetical protein JRI91_15395, partial [Deltaproteobacteria bacterium]|nr:hypothetical protein [Deltaproteobacteria bacterium]
MMKKYMLLAIIIMALLFTSCQSLTGSQTSERRPSREKTKIVTMEAEVEEIDLQERTVTLRGSLGNLVTLKVDSQVKRLNEIKRGDIVQANYWTYIFSEFRSPTPEEEKNPIVVYADADIAPAEKPPGASAGIVVRAVVTVEIINRADKLVTIKGPKGKYLTLPVEDKSLLEDLKVGEIVIMTY